MAAKLILEDGTEFTGELIGSPKNVSGEVVFTTGMTGYQEVLTDPSFCNQIVTFTYPLVGNYGINRNDFEAVRPYLKGIITREVCDTPSNWQSKMTLDAYLKSCKMTGLTGVDTRQLTKVIRERGAMPGRIVCEEEPIFENQALHGRLVEQVATREPYVIPGDRCRIVLLDLGVKQNLITSLNNLGATIIVLSPFTPVDEILSYDPHGIVLSSGPGDPQEVKELTETIEKFLEKQLPILGVCLGHQLLGLTLGYGSYKMKFGHRGTNHPVKDLKSGKVNITSQNHGYVLSGAQVPEDTEITHINLNDDTVEGLRHKKLPIISVQFHPEASPGPGDSQGLLKQYINLVDDCQELLARHGNKGVGLSD